MILWPTICQDIRRSLAHLVRFGQPLTCSCPYRLQHSISSEDRTCNWPRIDEIEVVVNSGLECRVCLCDSHPISIPCFLHRDHSKVAVEKLDPYKWEQGPDHGSTCLLKFIWVQTRTESATRSTKWDHLTQYATCRAVPQSTV